MLLLKMILIHDLHTTGTVHSPCAQQVRLPRKAYTCGPFLDDRYLLVEVNCPSGRSTGTAQANLQLKKVFSCAINAEKAGTASWTAESTGVAGQS